MESNFICCICHKVPSNVVESACCHSLFCWDCVVGKASVQACPACNGELNPETCTENLAVKKIIEGINVKCSNNGCYEIMPASSRSAHEDTCPKGSTLCPNSELCGIMERGTIASHLLICEYRRIVCHKCDLSLPLPQLMDHLDTECVEVVIECPNLCRSSLRRKNISEHVADHCPNSEVDCPFADYGCTVKPTRSTKDSHLSDNVVQHMNLMFSTIRDQQNQINSLRDQLVATQEAVSNIPSEDNSNVTHSPDQRGAPRNGTTLEDIVNSFRNDAFTFSCDVWRTMTPQKAVTFFILFTILARIFLPMFIFWVLLRLVKWFVVARVGVVAYRRIKRIPLHRVHPCKIIFTSVAAVVVLPWIYHL